jgi:hypothetical protein
LSGAISFTPQVRRVPCIALTAPTSVALTCPVEEPSTASEADKCGEAKVPADGDFGGVPIP